MSSTSKRSKSSYSSRSRNDHRSSKAASVSKDVLLVGNAAKTEGATIPMNGIFQAEAVVGRRVVRGKTQYKVKWFGYPEEDCTWEPLSNIGHCREFIDEFNRRRKEENPATREKRKSGEAESGTANASLETARASSDTSLPSSTKKRSRSVQGLSTKELKPTSQGDVSIVADEDNSVPEPKGEEKDRLEDVPQKSPSPDAWSDIEKEDAGRRTTAIVTKSEKSDACVDTESLARETSRGNKIQQFIPFSSLLYRDTGASGSVSSAANESAYRIACLAELKKAAPRAVRVIGVTCKADREGTLSKEPYAVIHFRPVMAALPAFLSSQAGIVDGLLRQNTLPLPNAPVAEKEYIQAYPIRHVRQVLPDKLVAYYQSLAGIMS